MDSIRPEIEMELVHVTERSRKLVGEWTMEVVQDLKVCFNPDIYRMFGMIPPHITKQVKKFNKRKQQRRATCGYRRK